MEDIITLEKRRADAIAEEYQSKGYEVSRGVVLDFFPGFRVDMVAKKGDESKVIEVKTRTSYAREPAISKLADTLRSKPGWSFVLNLMGEPEVIYPPDDARPFEREDVLGRIENAERLLGLGFSEGAYLLAWSAAEATVRLLIEAEGVCTIKRMTNSGYTLGTAVTEGVLRREDYDYLFNMMRHRNAVIHGFNSNDFDKALVPDLIETTRRLLQEL